MLPNAAPATAPGISRIDPAASVVRPGDILALATSTAPWSPAVMAGIGIAARWGSHLTGCFVDLAVRALADGEPEPTVLGLLLDPRAEYADECAAFAAFAGELGVRETSWTVAHAGVAQTLRQLGAWHDLAIMERDMVETNGLLDILGEGMLASHLPCLLLPPAWDRDVAFERIVVGWNGSVEAIRAIHSALPFLKVAREVLLVDGDLHGAPEPADGSTRIDPFIYLIRHHVTARPRYVRASSEMAGEILLREARLMRADLLVMGGYGHSRMRERVFGGATRHVLEHATLPVLMQH